MDIVRELLFLLEEKQATGIILHPDVVLPGRSSNAVGYHLQLLAQAGLVDAEIERSRSTPGRIILVHPFGLTWEGHELLDSIRDPEVWRRTKQGAAKAGGLGFSFMVDLAKAYGKHIAKERLGLEF